MKCLVDTRYTSQPAMQSGHEVLKYKSARINQAERGCGGGGCKGAGWPAQNSSELHLCTRGLCREAAESSSTASTGAAAHLMNLPSLSYFLPNVTGE